VVCIGLTLMSGGPALPSVSAQYILAEAAVSQEDFGDIEAIGHLGGMAFAINLTDDAHHAFMAVGSGLHVFDISDPAQLRQETALPLRAGGLLGLARSENTLYTASFHGLRIFDVSQPTQPTQLGRWEGDELRDVDVARTTLYLTQGDQGLRILDVSNPASPQLLGTFATPGDAGEVQVVGDVAYVTCYIDWQTPCPNAGIIAVDVHDPAHPVQLGAYAAPKKVMGLQALGDRAYLAVGEAGLLILDVSDPAHPALLGSYDSPGWSSDVLVAGTTAYLADGGGTLILDVSDPAHPVKVGAHDGRSSSVLAITGSQLFVGGLGDLYALDVSQPAHPALLGWQEWPGTVEDVFIPQAAASGLSAGAPPYGYFAGMDKLWVMNLTTPAMPATVATVPFTAGFPKRVFVADDLAYVMQSSFGLEIFDVSDPLHPAAAGKYPISSGQRHDVFARDGYAYVAVDDNGGRLIILDMRDPAHPQEVVSLTTSGQAKRVFVAGDRAYVADGDAGLRIIDVSDPAHPAELGHLAPPEGTSSEALFVDGTTAYVGSNGGSGAWIQKIDATNPAQPRAVGAFQQPAPKRVMDIEMAGGELYVAVDGGSVYVVSATNMQVNAIYHAEHTARVAVTTSGCGEVYSYLTGGSSYGVPIPVRKPPHNPCEDAPKQCLKRPLVCPPPQPGYEQVGEWYFGNFGRGWGKGTSPDYIAIRGCTIVRNFIACTNETFSCVYEPDNIIPQLIPPRPAAFSSDLGDAPDSSNGRGNAPMRAYTGVPARFPTVFGAGSPPYGPKHENVLAVAGWLGPGLTGEDEADNGPDADPTNNILPATDQANLDGKDDGVALPISMQNCQPSTLQFTVAIPEDSPQVDWVVNVWFDWDRNGAWGNVPSCNGEEAPEWAVQNLKLGKLTPGYHIFQTQFLPYNPDPTKPMWMRITLSEQAAPSADGSGLAAGYRYGETEDYYLTSTETWSGPELGPGESHEQTFPQMGNYPYYDRHRPNRQGIIRVRPITLAQASGGQSVTEVHITDAGFEPQVVTVDIGDTVRWVNDSQENHGVTGGMASLFYIPLLLH